MIEIIKQFRSLYKQAIEDARESKALDKWFTSLTLDEKRAVTNGTHKKNKK